jgi:hypothetical protein
MAHCLLRPRGKKSSLMLFLPADESRWLKIPASSAIPASRCDTPQGLDDCCCCVCQGHIGQRPDELQRSLTWDQGKEKHARRRFTASTNSQIDCCNPRSPWQSVSNENTNDLPRQYSHEDAHLSELSERDCSTAQSTSAKDLGLRNASR